MGRMSFLLPNQQCQDIEGNSVITDGNLYSMLYKFVSHFYFIYHCTCELSCVGGRHNMPPPLQVDL